MSELEDLLELQQLDTTADQLRHRLAALPERAALEQRVATISSHDEQTAELQSARDELARDQRRLEDEVALVQSKAAEVDRSLYGGTITSPRELQALQEDLASLKRRQSQLEDQVIEVMERAEPLDHELAEMTVVRADMARRGAELEVELARAEGDAGVELRDVESRRAELAPAINTDLLDSYERLRTRLGGVGVARLVNNSCGGCHLTLSAVELDRIRRQPPDALVYCEECGRLLVR